MMIKFAFGTVRLVYGNECRKQILEGVRLVKKAASITLGPFVLDLKLSVYIREGMWDWNRNLVCRG